MNPNGIPAATARSNITVASSPLVTTTPARSSGTPALSHRAASRANAFGRYNSVSTNAYPFEETYAACTETCAFST